MLRNSLLHLFMLEEILTDEDEERDNRIPRVFRDRINFPSIEQPPSNFREDFRIDAPVVQEILNSIGRFLRHETKRNMALSPEQQVLLTLHWLGHGAQYHVSANAHGVGKSSVCRYVHKVAKLINRHLFHRYVGWSNDTERIVEDFESIAGLPHVTGLIDGTLIYFDPPKDEEAAYVDRKNRHSINLTLVAGPQHQFFFPSCKCPGSVHDSRALRVSNLWQRWNEEGWRPNSQPQAIILGDSAYPLISWLLMPIVRRVNDTEDNAVGVRRYARHRQTRFKVENAIGILREQFPCLNQFRIRKPSNVAGLAMCCVTLHNMQNRYRHGSYEYDDHLQAIANREAAENAPSEIYNDNENDNMSGVERQLQFIQYLN